MKKIIFTLTILILIALYFGCTQGEKKIMLSYKYVPGTILTYEQNSHRTTKVLETDSVVEDYKSSYIIHIEQEIIDFKENVGQIKEASSWTHKKKNPDDSTKIDTIETTREIDFFVQTNGKIVDIQFPPDRDDSYTTYVKNYFEQGMPQFPAYEIPVGYSWTQTTKVVLPDETMEASTNYSIKSLVRERGYDCAVIEYEGNLLIPIVKSPKDSTQRHGLDKIQATGMIYFAHKEGFIVLQRERMVIDGYRNMIEEGEEKIYQLAIEADTDFALKKVEKP